MSLLLSGGIPNNPALLAAWAERIRDRVCCISKTLLRLEQEKQSLLCLLEEAGMYRYSIQEVSVVDLLSQDALSVAETLPLAQAEDILNVQMDPDFLEGINPMDLTYVRSEAEEVRVQLLSEFALIDWNKVGVQELKEWAKFFGMKPAQGRNFLISEFTRFFEYLSDTPKVCDPPKTVSLHTQFIETIKADPKLYDRILLFETVEIAEVFQFLKSQIHATPFSLKCVKDFFTMQQLHCSNTVGNSVRHKRTREESPPKTRRELRRSITCP